MPDVYLYPGETNPNDVRLRDPTTAGSGGSVGVLAGAIPLAFAPSGTLTGTGALVGAIPLAFAPTGTLAGSGALVGAIPLTITVNGALTGAGRLVGAVPLAFTPAGTLTGTGALAGAVSVSFSIAGTLTDVGAGAMVGSVGLNFTVIGALSGAGALAGTTALAFTVAGSLAGAGALVGSSALAFAVSGALTDSGSTLADPYPKPAGRVLLRGNKRKKRYEVEIDGQVFEVESVQEAQALLDRARELAIQRAPEVVDAVVERKLTDMPPQSKPIRVPVPQIHTDDQALVEIVIRARHAIAKIYREQAMMAEIRLRMELKMREEDENDVLILLL